MRRNAASPVFNHRWRLVYRYNVWTHSLDAAGHSGTSHIPSGDFEVSLGTFDGSVGTALQQSGTFVHELGHDLSLQHGGADSINYKPNYLSVMNYSFQVVGILPTHVIDYSRAALPPLVETSLSEPAGIGDGTSETLYMCSDGTIATAAGNAPINWDCLPPPNTATDVGVVADINRDRVCVDPGTDDVLQSTAGGDDVVAGGFIAPGPNLTIDSAVMGDDTFGFSFALHETIILPGPDGRLETVPAMDDVAMDQVIWDGVNRTCDSAILGDDAPDAQDGIVRLGGNVEPATLTSFDDWQHVAIDFDSTLHGFALSGSAGTEPVQELDVKTAKALEVQGHLADLSIAQTFTRSVDGVTINLTVTNHGAEAAMGPTVHDRLPATLAFKSCVATGGGACHGSGSYVAAVFASLAVGAITACTYAASAVPNTATVSSASTDPNPANNTATAQVAAPDSLPVVQLPNGDMRYAITFSTAQAYVEAFVQQNGVQNISGNIVSSHVTNADGTITYSRVVPASQYHAGDVINARFYSYRSGQPAVYTPGPLEFVSYPSFIYGAGSSTCSSACRPTFAELPNGDVSVSITLQAPQSYVEAFVRANSTQVASGSVVPSGVANFDGTFTYRRVVPASNFKAGDHVTFRFYYYVTGQPANFSPGPTASTFAAGFVYGHSPTSDCSGP